MNIEELHGLMKGYPQSSDDPLDEGYFDNVFTTTAATMPPPEECNDDDVNEIASIASATMPPPEECNDDDVNEIASIDRTKRKTRRCLKCLVLTCDDSRYFKKNSRLHDVLCVTCGVLQTPQHVKTGKPVNYCKRVGINEEDGTPCDYIECFRCKMNKEMEKDQTLFASRRRRMPGLVPHSSLF